jgi:hypothetical protein
VFRGGGPRYLLPAVLRVEGYRLYLVLVDIAPPEVSQVLAAPAESSATQTSSGSARTGTATSRSQRWRGSSRCSC